MRILVTGVGGFVAEHLIRELLAHGHEVWGTGQFSQKRPDLIGGQLIVADIRSSEEMSSLFHNIKPEVVFHLAAQSSPALSWDIPKETFDVNLFGTIEIIRWAAEAVKHPKVIFISSADVYGVPEDEKQLPLRETSPLRPQNPYAISKLAAEHAARIYGARHGADVLVMRPFSHTGPGQSTHFVVPSFAHQIALIEAGRAPALRHGDLQTWRDFSDVRDVVRAYRLAAESPVRGGVFNVCSGESVCISELLDTLCRMASATIQRSQDVHRLRGERPMKIRGDSSSLRCATGWKPTITLRETLQAVLEEQREQIACASPSA